MAQVRVILSEEISGLGSAGDLVDVKPGFARNYLIPKGMALLATEAQVKELEHHRRIIAEKNAQRVAEFEGDKQRIEKLELEVEAQAGAEGKLFGSVTSRDIAALLKEQGVEIDRRKLALPEPIKTTGEHEVTLKLHSEVTATVHLTVTGVGGVAEEEEVEADAFRAAREERERRREERDRNRRRDRDEEETPEGGEKAEAADAESDSETESE